MGPELFNAEETTGPRTMCRKRRNYHHDDKTSFFFSATRNTLLEVLVWKKESDAVSNPDKTWDYFQGKDEVLYKQLKKKSREFLRGAEDIPIPATAPNWNMALSWLAFLPALLHLLSHSRGAEHAQRSRVIAPPPQMCPKISALRFYARSWRRCAERKKHMGAVLLKDTFRQMPHYKAKLKLSVHISASLP